MPKLFRCILIDPESCSIKQIESDASLRHIHRIIGCDCTDNFRIADHGATYDYGMVDDTGLQRGEPIHAFLLSIRKEPIAGRCFVFGVEKEGGETTDAKFPLDVLRAAVTWLGLIRPEVTWERVGPVERAIVTYERVK